jgi:DNA repair protein RadD
MKTLYYYQQEAIQAVWNYYESGKAGNVVIALPTGTGKGTVIAELIRRVMTTYRGQRILSLTHVKTLIGQNYDDLLEQWPTAPAGIYSAGLRRKDAVLPIVFGGVQSVVNAVERFGHRDLVIIDEAHLISPKAETTYQKVLASLKEINPHLKVIGLSATPYRLGQGLLTEDGIFDDVVYDMTTLDGFNKLLEEGYLLPPIPKRTLTELDLSEVHIQAGEFNQSELEAASNKPDVNLKICKEMCEMAYARRSWLVFTSSIKHADDINAILRMFGVDSEVVHSEKGNEHNDKAIKRWKAGQLRCIVNKDMLTTGVNNRACDFIAALRGTTSASLWVQMLGRGTRTSPETGKVNCLVADFAGNTRRLGPINDPVIPSKPGKRTGPPGQAPIRICDECGVYNHANARICISCGFEFPLNSKLKPFASEAELVRTQAPVIENFDVNHVVYHRHQKAQNPPVIRVSYHCGRLGLTKFDEWVMLEHKGFPRKKARDWWRARFAGEPPESTDEALQVVAKLRVPRKIRVWTNRTYPDIMGVEF